jgi:hypothetical protein
MSIIRGASLFESVLMRRWYEAVAGPMRVGRAQKKCPRKAGKQSPQVSAWTKDRAASLGGDRSLWNTRKEVGRAMAFVVAARVRPGSFKAS